MVRVDVQYWSLSLRCGFVFILLSLLSACAQAPNELGYRASNSKLPLNQTSFAEYQTQTHRWLSQHRAFISNDHQAELAANTPFELMPQIGLAKTRGVLLVHGLLDSPYSFVDIAPKLAAMGYRVRTVLLEGHGSRPANLLATDADNWKKLVMQQVKLFKPYVDELYLGGFSTGANLVAEYAMDDDDIKGLMMFSPGFKSNIDMDWMAPIVPLFSDWMFTPSLKYQSNYVRYMTGPSNAYAQYYRTSEWIRDKFERQSYDKPVFMALSEHDSIINPHLALKIFTRRIKHPDSRLIWFGDAPTLSGVAVTDSRIVVLPKKVPAYRISNYSHMGILFALDNPYYGFNGSQKFCPNGQGDEAFWRCVKGEPMWYSAYGYLEQGKEHARLTFNPQFDFMMETLHQVFIQP